MDLNDALKQFEAVEANYAKLERLGSQIKVSLQTANEAGQYSQLHRSFELISKQMPTIEGFALELCLPQPNDIKWESIVGAESRGTKISLALEASISRQVEILSNYRSRLEAKRRELARQAVETYCTQIETKLSELKPAARKRKHNAKMPKKRWEELKMLFKSIDALLGNSLARPARWSDMARHLAFGVKCDYNDIVEQDWPNIRQWLDRSLYGDSDPLPVTTKDLGDVVSSRPQGPVSTELRWEVLTPADFERLILNLIDCTPTYENARLLTHTNAPDRGRDLSVERVTQDPLTGTRRHRIILACKHTSSVNLKVVAELREQMKLWEPPKVDELIIVTAGRFTTDAIDYIERHNRGTEPLRIEMWPDSRLERLLADRPQLIAEFRLRK